MNPTGLYWRTGLPFLLLMIVATVAIALALRAQFAAQARARLAELAATDEDFIENGSLQPTEKLAADLRRVNGFDVHFRVRGQLVPPPRESVPAAQLMQTPTDGEVHALGASHEVVGRELAGGALLLVRRVGEEVWDPRIVQVVGALWALALLTAVLVVRGLVRPLRNLAAQLPNIESPAPLEVPEAARRDEIGDVARALVASHGDLHRERERRLEAEKLAVLGRMTASLAHQLQNPVAAIKMHAQLWRSSGDGQAGGPADVVEDEAGRIERLLNQWMYLTRPEPPAVADADVGALLDDVLRAHRARLSHAGVEVRSERAGSLALRCDRERLTHVFDNLMTNAVQAMPEGGALTVRAAHSGDDVVVEFEDEGTGFSPEALDRVGEFFYSEKEGGMGIGLAVAREVVVAHGGDLRAENHAAGARVTVRLPRGPAAPAPDRGGSE